MANEGSASVRRKVILVTGASAGLGEAMAREVANRGIASGLVLTARRENRLAALEADLLRIDPALQIFKVAADLVERNTPERLVNATVHRFGGLDVLVNNAGLGLPTLFADGDPDQLRRQIEVNLTAPLLLARYALPHLISSRGMLINIGSAITCVANSSLGAYGATKAGLAYWNDALRRELHGTGLRVCLVEPGPIRTEFSDALGRLVPEGGRANPVVETPSEWMTADVTDVARRIVGLIDHPRRRLSVLRRLVWPFRIMGAVCSICPPLGDLIVTRVYHVQSKPTAGDS